MDNLVAPEGTPVISFEEALAKIQCPELEKLKTLFPEMEFTDELAESPHLGEYL